MAEKDTDPGGAELSLAEVLSALSAELHRAESDDGHVRVETATVDLDVAVVPGGDGGIAFRVGQGGGGGKRRTTRLSVTLRAGEAASGAAAGDATSESAPEAAPEPDGPAAPPPPAVGEVTPPEPRPLGLVDVLADAIKTIADNASKSAGTGWPPRPGAPAGGSGTEAPRG